MVYLVDTNVILELLLDQEMANEVEEFLRAVPPEHLWLSDFSLHSIGVLLVKRSLHDVFVLAVDDLLMDGDLRLVSLGQEDMREVADVAIRFRLDFDDAYQYAAAQKHDLTIVSLDSDFDRTDRGRKTPSHVLEELPQKTDQRP